MTIRVRMLSSVVIPTIKLKILKANHNTELLLKPYPVVVIPTIKLKILKANHNTWIL